MVRDGSGWERCPGGSAGSGGCEEEKSVVQELDSVRFYGPRFHSRCRQVCHHASSSDSRPRSSDSRSSAFLPVNDIGSRKSYCSQLGGTLIFYILTSRPVFLFILFVLCFWGKSFSFQLLILFLSLRLWDISISKRLSLLTRLVRFLCFYYSYWLWLCLTIEKKLGEDSQVMGVY